MLNPRRQVGGPAPRGLPSPGAACAGGAPNRPRPRARAVRPARRNPWGRSGRLHAPEAARTGPVNALRRYSSWSPPGRWLNGHNGHFLGQPGRGHLGTSPGGYGSGFNGPRAVLKILPNTTAETIWFVAPKCSRNRGQTDNEASASALHPQPEQLRRRLYGGSDEGADPLPKYISSA